MPIANLDMLLRRHRAFWERDPVEKPLVKLTSYSPLKPENVPLSDGRFADGQILSPQMLDAKVIAEWQSIPTSPVNGDLFAATSPFGLCWTEAILGCPIKVSAGSPWATPFLKDLSRLDSLHFNPKNPWLQTLLELTRLLVEKVKGYAFVTQTLLRGPIDMAAAALGYERLCIEVYRNIHEVERLLSVSTEVFLEIAQAHLSLLPPLQEGFISGYDIWAPGTTIRSQTDNSVLLPPKVYADCVLPFEKRILKAFEYPLMHTHQPCMSHVVEPLLGTPELKALQMSLDRPNGPPVSEILPLMQKILERKPLIVTGAVMKSDLKLMLEALDPKGLCLNLSIWSEKERIRDLCPVD